jgi:hypothetical protein
MKAKLSVALASAVSLLLLTVASSSALGAEFEGVGGVYPQSFSNINATLHFFNLNATDKVECEGAKLKGELASKSPKLVLAPEYTGCVYYDGAKFYGATITTKCAYEFTITGGTSSPFTGKMKIINTGCQILIFVPSQACEVSFEPQGPNSSVEYTVSSPTMKWSLAVSSLKYHASGSCPGVPAGNYATGEYAAQFSDQKIIVH